MVLSANRQTGMKELPMIKQVFVAGSAHIYMGSLVCHKADGYATPGADTAGYVLAGVAREEMDNSASATDGAVDGVVYTKGAFLLKCAGATRAWEGRPVYITDDETVALSSTNGILAGICRTFVSATAVWVDIEPAIIMASTDLTLAGTFTVAGVATMNGAVNLGNAAADIVTLNGVFTVGATGSFTNSGPTIYRATLVAVTNAKETVVVWAGGDHPKCRVLAVTAALLEVPDGGATTYTINVTRTVGGAENIISSVITFTEGTDTVGKRKAGTVDTDHDNLALATDLNVVAAGTTTTLGRALVIIDVVGE